MDDLHGDQHNHTFTKTQASGARIDGVEFIACTFAKCNFRETQFVDCKFVKCVFKDCDLSLAKFDDAHFSETRFADSKLLGVNWTSTAWAKARLLPIKPVDFTGCTLNYNVFMGMNLRAVSLNKCIVHEAGFEDASLVGADCRESDFSGSRFARADLSRADFRGARNYAISPLGNKIKGAKFSLPEAIQLLEGLEIELDPETR